MLSLLLTALIWGFAFVAQVQGMDSMSPMFFNAARFTLGALSLVPILLWMRGRGSADKGDTAGADVVGTEASVAVSTDAASNGASDVVTITGAKLNANKPDSAVARLLANPVVISVICGIVLFTASTLQQYGILYGKSAGRAGFLTAMYIVMVPLLAFVFLRRRIAGALGMNVSAWNSHVPEQVFADLNITPVNDMNELITGSDVVSIHMPLLDSTKGIVTAENLEALKPGTMFINTARAEIIEPGALLARLQRGDIPAALDVFEHEPLTADDPLCSIPGIILTPHTAWRTDGAYVGITRQVVQSVAAFCKGEDFNVVV